MPVKQDRPGEQSERERELDDFWDISRLLPDTSRQSASPRRRIAPAGVEIELDPPQSKTAATDMAPEVQASTISPRTDLGPTDTALTGAGTVGEQLGRAHFIPPHTASAEHCCEPARSYGGDGVLLHRVDVYVWKSGYRYFDQFIQDVADYAARPAPTRRPSMPTYFSFFPQYAQLSRSQAAWYLWWRDQVRHGAYPETGYAYILLYVFELINQPLSPEESEQEQALETGRQMGKVWMAYRQSFPQLDHYMCEWLCDFCLIHEVPAPVDILAPALNEIVGMSSMKEFYLSAAVGAVAGATGQEKTPTGANLSGARVLLRYCCQYDYKRSKFASGEHAALFDRVVPNAVAEVIPLLMGKDGQKPLITMQDSTVTRDAYTGALCAYRNKRRVVVSYVSFSRSHELRYLIGDMVRHIENRLRSHIGVRSRLSVMSLPVPIREALDAYLDPLLPKPEVPSKPKRKPDRPTYEALYDLPVKPISLEDAARIEQTSWETTRILTDAFGSEEDTVPEVTTQACELPAPMSGSEPTSISEKMQMDGSSSFPDAPALADFLRLAYMADATGQRALAARLHVLPDALADRINEWATESDIGDVILEETGAGYTVMADYREAVAALLATHEEKGDSNE